MTAKPVPPANPPPLNGRWPPHGLRASFLAPHVAPFTFFLWQLPAARDPLERIGVLFAFGSVMAYAAMLGIGLPALAILA